MARKKFTENEISLADDVLQEGTECQVRIDGTLLTFTLGPWFFRTAVDDNGAVTHATDGGPVMQLKSARDEDDEARYAVAEAAVATMDMAHLVYEVIAECSNDKQSVPDAIMEKLAELMDLEEEGE